MAQQLAIIVLVDIASALQARSLDGNVHLFDNMRFQGSEGEGTGDLVTAVRGSYWSDGSQGTEQVLNWLPAALGAIPPTVPRSYQADRARRSDQRALSELREAGAGDLDRIRRQVGTKAAAPRRGRALAEHKILDVTGQVAAAGDTGAHNHPTPVITGIVGEAVEEKIIYPAEYGSPDMVSDGWYWSATVDTSRPGTYAYTMNIQLHELVERNGEPAWEPVDLSCESRLKVTTDPKRNAFTKAGLGLLPIPPAPLP